MNTLDDAARDAKFESVKQATLDRIFGKCPIKVNDEVETSKIDFKFGTGKSWLDEPRMTGNNDMVGIGEHNAKMHECNGYMVA